jgi:internalin A
VDGATDPQSAVIEASLLRVQAQACTSLALLGPGVSKAYASQLLISKGLSPASSLQFQLDVPSISALFLDLRSLVGVLHLAVVSLWVGDKEAKALASGLPQLRSLALPVNQVGDEGARAIASGLTQLTSLDLSSNDIGTEGARAIASGLPQLTSLDLSSNDVGADGARALVYGLPQLKRLALCSNRVGTEGARAIASGLPHLTSLDLRSNDLGIEGARAIASGLRHLTSLDLSSNEVSDEGAKAIASGPRHLRRLVLRSNGVSIEGARAIASGLPHLTSLDLSFNGVGTEGVRAIASGLPDLTSLDLSSNDVGIEGAKAIASLHHLTSLDLSSNDVGTEGARAIASALPDLTSLDLSSNDVSDEGAKAIATALHHLTSLELSSNDVGTEGAKAIATALPDLTSLDLASNHLGAEGARAIASALPHLTSLDLSSNHVGAEGAKAIASGLPQLRTLVLDNNGIGAEGAEAIASGLAKLTSLHLAFNEVGDDGARSIASGLPQLTNLDLRSNEVADDGAMAIASGLRQLTVLVLSYNAVADDGAKAIFAAHLGEGGLRHLDLRKNRLSRRGLLPPELLQTTNARSILAAYRRFATTPAVELLPLNEAKLLVVGNEAVGKTSLVRFLTTGVTRDPGEPKTLGTAISERIETRAWRDEGSPIQLNVWDFGGQEIMHGTHRFFLSERSLYLLVLEARREDDESVFSWLKTIRNRGGESPVIVVINKCDDGSHNLRVDETALQRDYPNVIGVVRTSCEPNQFAHQSIAGLRRLIADTLATNPLLSHARNGIPPPWLRVKAAVAALARDQSLLESRVYLDLCTGGDERDRITDVNEQGALLLLLHDLGVVVAHGLARDAPAALREVTLLDPNWLTGAVYALLNAPQVLQQAGEFSRAQLPQWLNSALYPPHRHEYILDMMQSQDLSLCFRLPTTQGDERYLLPEALPSNEPDFGTWPPDSLRFRFDYDYLPPGLIPRFIVQAHRHLTEKPTRWRTGVVLAVDTCPVLLKGDRERRRIDIAVTGPVNRRRSALAVVLEYLNVVHDLNPEAGPKGRVPLPDDPERTVGYDHLVELEGRESRDYRFYPEGAQRQYTVAELLDGVQEARVPSLSQRDVIGASSQSGGLAQAPSWTPAEAMLLGKFMLTSVIALVGVFLTTYIVAGTQTASAITALALGAVIGFAVLILRSSDQLSEGSLMEVLKRLLPRRDETDGEST